MAYLILSVIGASIAALALLSLTIRIDEGRMSDIELIRTEVENARAEIAILEFTSAVTTIQSDADFAVAQDKIAEAKGIAKRLREKLAAYVDPLHAVITLARADVGPRIAAAEEIERVLKAKCVAWRQAVTALRAQRESEARALLEAPAATVEAKRAALVAVAETVAPARKGTSFRDRWVWEVEDESKIADEYYVRVLDTARINREVKAGARKIPGLIIKNDPVMSSGST